MFVYQPIISTLELKEDKDTDTLLLGNRNDHLNIDSSHYIKLSAKTLNVYIACDLDDLPRNSHKNVILKNNLFGATNIVKIVLKVNMFFEAIE